MSPSPAALLTAGLLALGAASSALAQKTYVVTSDQPAFTEAARAAVEALGSGAELLRADDDAKAAVANADVVVAVGPLAARVVGSAAPRRRLVTCLIPHGVDDTLTVPLQAAAADVLLLVRQVLPTVRKVGVFPGADRSASEVTSGARAQGLDVELARPGEPFAAAVDRLLGSTDAIWIDDLRAVPNGGAALVVKKASELRKPVVGPNRATVLQGAFFAVVPDPSAHGRAAGEAALQLLKGQDVLAVPPPLGRVVINAALARALQVKLGPALARRSDLVE